MKITHIRNACMVIHSKGHGILVDPCLNPKATLPPYTLFRKKPRPNPLVDLPLNTGSVLNSVTTGLVTHCRYGHFDHLDGSGIRFLAQNRIPVYCSRLDEPYLKRRGIETVGLAMNQKNDFFEGSITPVPAKHGRGLMGRLMGPGAGYVIQLPDEKTVYISGDTVFTGTVKKVLTEFKPDIAVLNAGTAVLDVGKPILMSVREQLEFISCAPGIVVAVHLDAFNHCLTSRSSLRKIVAKEGLSQKVIIPEDGKSIDI